MAGKLERILSVMGLSLALTGCGSYPEMRNYKKITSQDLGEIAELSIKYGQALAAPISAEQDTFIKSYDPKKASSQEIILINYLVRPYSRKMRAKTTEEKWNTLELEEKRAFYERLIEIKNSRQKN